MGKLHFVTRDDEVLVCGEWFPVCGFALVVRPDGDTTGSIFTLKPIGKFEPGLGYRIDYSDIQNVRRALDVKPHGGQLER